MSSTALPLAALFPQLSLTLWAVIMGVAGFLMVWFNAYATFEKITAALIATMFITVVGLAIIATPNIPDLLAGLVPMIPEGGLVYTLALAGGVGGTITLAAYGYWLREKGWVTPKWMKVMRIDNTMAYVLTGVFVLSMLIVGAEVVQAAGVSVGAVTRVWWTCPTFSTTVTARSSGRPSSSGSGQPRSPRSSACGTASR